MKEAKDWEKYLLCEPRPNAQVEGDVNSFLNAWLLEDTTDLVELTAACASAAEVMDDLVYVGARAQGMNDAVLYGQSAAFITKVQRMIHDKIDVATAHVLQYADEYTDSSSRSEVKMASASAAIKLGLWVNLIPKGSRNKRIDFAELGISVELPKVVVAQPLALRVFYVPFDTLSSVHPQNVDFALGGVFLLELLGLPLPPKRARGWMMREIPEASDRIKRLHYPLDGMLASATSPIKVSVQLPSNVMFISTPRVGWWDPQMQSWNEEGIGDITFTQDTHTLAFTTMHMTHLAVVQQHDLNFQKYLWNLQMTSSADHAALARLTLKTEHFESIQIDITEEGCRLVAPALPQLAALQRNWLGPGEMLMRLTASGIGLCPDFDDDLRFGFTPKIKALESRVVQEAASIVSAYEISIGNLALESTGGGSKWISAIDNPKQIVFAVKEIFWPNITDPIDASSQGMRSRHPASASFLNVLAEMDEEASGGGIKFRLDRTDDPHDTHVHLVQALDAISSPDARDRMAHPNVLFEHTLVKLLSLLRIFSYSKPLSTRVELDPELAVPTESPVMDSGEAESSGDNASVPTDPAMSIAPPITESANIEAAEPPQSVSA